jgi:hypothetical protein
LKSPITKNWAGGVAQGEGPEFNPQCHTKNGTIHQGDITVVNTHELNVGKPKFIK